MLEWKARLAPLLGPVAGFLSLLGVGAIVPALTGVMGLALPFFGLILLGYVLGKLVDIEETGLAWMNAFIIYLALPALYFNLISVTPIGELANWRFILVTSLCTMAAFGAGIIIGWFTAGGRLDEATIQGVGAGYSNVGYMGPGLTLATFGTASVAPTALIFAFDSAIFFTIVPFLMGVASGGKQSLTRTGLLAAKRVLTHPFNVSIMLAALAAWTHWTPPETIHRILVWLQNAAAPCALFVMGVTVALRPVRGLARETPALLAIKLVAHPALVWFAMTSVGGFNPVWVYTAVLMAALPPALNTFVMARQYNVYVERASNLIMAGTVASVFTVTALLYVLTASGGR
ncbi:MAG: AEC family transporter [Beijerinckiaceae bacterium]